MEYQASIDWQVHSNSPDMLSANLHNYMSCRLPGTQQAVLHPLHLTPCGGNFGAEPCPLRSRSFLQPPKLGQFTVFSLGSSHHALLLNSCIYTGWEFPFTSGECNARSLILDFSSSSETNNIVLITLNVNCMYIFTVKHHNPIFITRHF